MSDFTKINKYNNILCSSFKYNLPESSEIITEYITNYLKKFYNNDIITPELLLLNYHLNIDLNSCKLVIIESNLIKELNLNEQIHLKI